MAFYDALLRLCFISLNKHINLECYEMAKATKEANNATLGIEQQIWNVTCDLFGNYSGHDCRKIIVGLIFLRYISASFEAKYKKLVAEGQGFENDIDEFISENLFYVPEKARWSHIAENAHTSEIGKVLDEAMSEIENSNDVLKNIFPKVYGDPYLNPKVLGKLVDLFTNIDMSDISIDKDIFGRIFEHCTVDRIDSYEGARCEDINTPSCITKIIVSILKPFDNCRIYDPCCGLGGLLVQAVNYIKAHNGNRYNVSVYGQEYNSDIWKMAKINMAIRGIYADLGASPENTFFKDLHPKLKADFIIANPPFNSKKWGRDELFDDVRWKFGIPPACSANYAWIQHTIYHLAPNGKIGIVLPVGSLFSQRGGEREIRKAIIENDYIEGIIALPTCLYYGTRIPVALWFITKNKKQSRKTIFIDASKMGQKFYKNHRELTEEDIELLAKTFEDFQEGKDVNKQGFCAIASSEDIRCQNYNLTPEQYVGIEGQEKDEPLEDKMKHFPSEFSDLFNKSNDLEYRIKNKLKSMGLDFEV